MARVQLTSTPDGVIVNNENQLLAGASVMLYSTGTLTAITVYEDAVSGLTLTQPLISDVDGRLPGFADSSQTLDVSVTYDGVTFDTVQLELVRGDTTPQLNPMTGKVVADELPPLDQIPAPVASVNAAGHKITSLGDATAAGDALNRGTGDGRYALASALPTVNLREGAPVAGTWDAAFAAALTLATATRGGRIMIPWNPAGNYVFASPLPNLAGIQIDADDQAVLDFSSVAADSQLIQFAGSAAATVPLDADANTGTVTVNVTVPSLTAGDLVKIGSSATVDQGRSGMKIGEIGRVLSVGSGQFTLRSPLLKGPYLTSDSAFAQRIVPGRGRWSGGRILGGGSGSGHQGLLLDYTLGARVDASFENCEKTGLVVRDSWKTRAALSVKASGYATLGYGAFVSSAAMYTEISGVFEDCRHAITTGGPSSRSGCPLFIDFHDFEVLDSAGTGDAVDTHSGGDFVQIHDGAINDSARSGVNVECANAKVHDLIITNPATYGVMAVNYSNYETSHEIHDIEVIGAPLYAVRTSAPPTTTAGSLCRKIAVKDIVATRCKGAVLAQSKNSYRLSNVLIDRVTSIQQTGLYAVYADGIDLLQMPKVTVAAAPGNSTPIRVLNTTLPDIGGGLIDFVAQAAALSTTLAASLAGSDTTAQLTSVSGLASSSGSITVETEPLSYAGIVGSTLQNLRRSAIALLLADTAVGASTFVLDQVPSSWPASGQARVDAETLSYSSVTGSTLNLSSPTAAAHSANAIVSALIAHAGGAAVTAADNVGARFSNTANGDIGRFIIRNAITPILCDDDCVDLELAKPHAVNCAGSAGLGAGAGVRMRRGTYSSQRTNAGPVSTMDRLLVASSVGTLASGQVYGARATCDDGGQPLAHVRFATGSGAPSGVTDLRVGVWSPDGATKLAETANLSGTVTSASTEYEAALGAALTPYDGQDYILALAFLGTSLTVRGYAGIAAVNSVAPAFTLYTTGWAGGVLPSALGSSGTGQTPWLEMFA